MTPPTARSPGRLRRATQGHGTQIVELKSDSNYEVGTTWIAFAIVRNGEFRGRRLLLPTGDSVVDW
jgi:hypothetical protein